MKSDINTEKSGEKAADLQRENKELQSKIISLESRLKTLQNKIPDPEIQRLQPHSEELEQIVLGSLMLDPEMLELAMGMLRPTDFYNSNHRMIYKGIDDLSNKRHDIDPLILAEKMKEMNCLDEVGGAYYLSQLPNMVSSTVSVEHYGNILIKKGKLRNLITESGRVLDKSFQPEADPDVLIDEFQQKLFDIQGRGKTSNYLNASQAVDKFMLLLDRFKNAKDGLIGYPTGFYGYDRMTGGINFEEIIVLGARPGGGKSAAALQIIDLNCAQGTPIGLFSLEMTAAYDILRMSCAKKKVNWHYKRQSKDEFEEKYAKLIEHAREKIAKYPLYIDERTGLNALEIRRTMMHMNKTHGIKFFLIDHGNKMGQFPQSTNENDSVGKSIATIKDFTKENGFATIYLTQLNRAGALRRDPTPIASDARGSGVIEQEADVIWFLHRPFMHLDPTKQREIKNELRRSSCIGEEREKLEKQVLAARGIVNKNRMGPTGEFDFGFQDKYASFFNITDEQNLSESERENEDGLQDKERYTDGDGNRVDNNDEEPF